MKKQAFFLTTLMFLVVLLTSCDKDSEIQPIADYESVADLDELAYAQHLATDIEETADEASLAPPPPGQERLRDCAEISSTAEKGVFPNTITVDFGTGCTGKNGKVRKGKVIITLSDSLHNEGATRSVSFEDYFVDDVEITGSKSWENLGISEDGLITIHKTADMMMNFPDGTSSQWSTDRTITKSTQFVKYRKAGKVKKKIIRFLGTVSVAGETSGTNRAGESFSAIITESLVKSENCIWFGSGEVELTKGEATRTLNYGDGDCDRIATVTLNDGSTKEIKIKPFFKR